MTSQFYARSHALIRTCPKTAFLAPRSTSSPHLAQTEKVRLMRFFAWPDSNTSPRVAINVLGHVVVRRMGIVQVPNATVILEYFRALSYKSRCLFVMLIAVIVGPLDHHTNPLFYYGTILHSLACGAQLGRSQPHPSWRIPYGHLTFTFLILIMMPSHNLT